MTSRMLTVLLVMTCVGTSCAPQIPPQSAARPLSAFACPAPNGTWSHDDCTKYWECYDGVPYEMTCSYPSAPLSEWHAPLKRCLDPTIAQCEPGNAGL
jgi:hypothetical protein